MSAAVFKAIFVSIGVGFLSSVALAVEPEIATYTETEITASSGDDVELLITTVGDKLNIRWYRGDEIICRTPRCFFSTKAWGLGLQKIVLVVSNKDGFRQLTYRIRIDPAPVDRAKKAVIKPKVVAAADAPVRKFFQFVQNLQGSSLVYRGEDVVRLEKYSESLQWSERIRTQPDGIAALHVMTPVEELDTVFLLPGTEVSLLKGPQGERAAVLQRGELRVRGLRENGGVSIMVGPWAQLDGDSASDYLIERERDGNQARLTVLRGNIRVAWRGKGESIAETPPVVRNIPAGAVLSFGAGRTDGDLETFDAKAVRENFKTLTPQYLTADDFKSSWIREKEKIVESVAVKKARELLGENDALMAIEYLLTAGKAKSPTTCDFYLALGEAYLALNLFPEAGRAFGACEEINPEIPQPRFGLGMIQLLRGDYDEAVSAFDMARKAKFPDEQRLSYYTGVAYARSGETQSARSAFQRVLWAAPSPDARAAEQFRQSAEDFLKEAEEGSSFDLELSGYGGFDSNPARIATVDNNGEALEIVSSAFYDLGMKLSVGPRKKPSHLALGVEASKLGYLNAALEPYGPTNVLAHLEMALGFPFNEDPLISTRVRPLFGMQMAGGVEVNDIVGAEFELEYSPTLLKPMLVVRTIQYLDPSADTFDVYDPEVEETIFAAIETTKRVLSLGIQVSPRLARTAVQVAVLYENMKYRNISSELMGFSGPFITGSAQHSLSPRWTLDGTLSVHMKKFDFDPAGRSDTKLGGEAGVAWAWTRLVSPRAYLRFVSNGSNVNYHAYSKFAGGLGLKLTF